MKFSSILFGAFATLTAAAPALDKDIQLVKALAPKGPKSINNAPKLNNLAFKQQDLNYLLKLNSLNLGLFQNLGINNNLDVLLFQELFNGGQFNLNALLQFQQLQTLLAIANTGVLDAVDLGGLALGGLNLGLINNLGGVDLSQFIDAALVSQIGAIAAQGE